MEDLNSAGAGRSTGTPILKQPDLPGVDPWLKPFEDRIAAELRPGVRILDVGSGRRPALPADQRPTGTHYAGLDVSGDELAAAPPGSYDESITSDITLYHPSLEGRFDLVISWQVLEHVQPLERAIENIRRYLVPGGTFVAQLSGRYSVFAIVNQVVPQRVGAWAMKRLLGRDTSTVFPAAYDKCSYSSLRRITSAWGDVEIIPRYHGATYFAFLPLAQRIYGAYEAWTERRRFRELATHYLIRARR